MPLLVPSVSIATNRNPVNILSGLQRLIHETKCKDLFYGEMTLVLQSVLTKFTILTLMGAQTGSSAIDTELWTLKIEMTPVTIFICNFPDSAPKALPSSSHFYFKTIVSFFVLTVPQKN